MNDQGHSAETGGKSEREAPFSLKQLLAKGHQRLRAGGRACQLPTA